MKSSYKEMMREVSLADQTKSRMLARLTEVNGQYENEGQEGKVIGMKHVSKKSVKGIVIAAAVVCLCVGTALAVCHQVFYNPAIVKDVHELMDIAEEGADSKASAIGIAIPVTGTPHAREDVIQEWSSAANDWDSETTIGGSFTSQYSDWQSLQVLEGEGPLKSRIIYDANGAEKRDYTAENPAGLLGLLSEHISLDLTWANEHYDSVPYGNRYYHIYAGDGTDVGEYLNFLYTYGDNAYVSMEITCDLTHTNSGVNEGVKGDSFDEAYYYYMIDNNMEFLITAYGDIVWAECTTANCHVSLYAGHMTTAQVEDFLTHLDLSLLDAGQTD